MYQNHDFPQSVGAIEYEFRSAERLTIPLPAMLRLADGPELEICLRDISSLGFMMECPELVPIGARVELILPAFGPLAAEVRWGLAGWIGCKLEEELRWDSLFLKLIGGEEGAAEA